MKTFNTHTVLLLALAVVGCSSQKPIQQAPQAVQAQQVQPESTTKGGEMRFSAVVTPDAQVPLSFRIPGYVVSLKQVRGEDGRMRDLAEGDRVSKGAVLIQIRSSEYQDKVHQASSQAAAAEAVAQRRSWTSIAPRACMRPRASPSRTSIQRARSMTRHKANSGPLVPQPARRRSLSPTQRLLRRSMARL